MSSTNRGYGSLWPAAVAVWALLVPTGCGGSSGPKMYAIKGQVQLADGEIVALAGQNVEAALESNGSVRAYGKIQEDGSFDLETLQTGVPVSGAVAGKYRVRVALSDDDLEARSRAAQAVHPRFLAFDSSGLSLDVPTDAAVVLQLSRQ